MLSVNRKNVHVIWSIANLEDVAEVFQLIDDALAPFGFTRETRPFTPHATIARVKSSDPSLFSALATLDKRDYGSCTIRGMTLKKSTLLPTGPVYEDLQVLEW